jgi:hypothetical protein
MSVFVPFETQGGIETKRGDASTSRLLRPFTSLFLLGVRVWLEYTRSFCEKQLFRSKNSKKYFVPNSVEKGSWSRFRSASRFKRPGARHRLRRLGQSTGETLGTGAEFAQIFEVINACAVAIAPGKIERIVSNRRELGPLNGRRDVSMADLPFPCELFDAFGTHAVFPQIPGWV